MSTATLNWRDTECGIKDCGKPLHNKKTGYCATHYNRWWRNGDPLLDKRVKTTICAVEDCDKKTHTKKVKFCKTHQYHYEKYGDPTKFLRPCGLSLAERLAYYSERLDDGCIIWTGEILKLKRGFKEKEYGRLIVNGDKVYAHRVAWEVANGEDVPEGMVVTQSCNKKLCINPEHLLLLTFTEAIQNQSTGHSDSLSGFRGVTYNKISNRWIAYVKNYGKLVILGYFTDLVEAANAARVMRLKLWKNNHVDQKPLTLADRLITPQNRERLIPVDICQQVESMKQEK